MLSRTKTKDHRPWGYFVVLSNELEHKVKRIVVYPKKRLSMQRHRYRSEHWYIIYGEAVVILNDKKIYLKAGESIDIPQEAVHRIENIGISNMAFIEIQRGEYFGEDDIERLEDDYGRELGGKAIS
ncbi:phosphomannose isomerase type II C-terminal cupin domain [bacterium]|nr:phosphomannose isomerase type II C-terminal cupin domain [bacterium]